ncbi:MAG: nuclear transport factor 2 family protein, partial [Chloroflexota bacterium]|nr:nuclear transport factor 2 family protein [Chloroflexota bacterium]
WPVPAAQWALPGPADVPLFGTYHGKAGAQQWLARSGEHVGFRVFEPREYLAQGDKVIVLLHAESTIKHTGRPVISDGAHVLTVRDGRLVRFVGDDNTAAIADAWRGQ